MSQNTSLGIRRPWLRWAALAAVVLVPLAFAGLFIGAVSGVTKGIDEIPAAVVNNDQAVTQVAADGTKSPILAGRELVTQLTGKKNVGFDWSISNSKDAAADLKAGKVFAVLTVPKDFSKSIVSISGKDPVKANLTISTDDSHNYLTGSVAQIVGTTLSSTFGKAVTKQYVAGLYAGIGGVGDSLQTAADGADKLGDGGDKVAAGVSSLSTGLSKLASGTSASASGARSLASGTSQYVGGVKKLASPTSKLSSGVTAYSKGVSQLSGALTQAAAGLSSTDPQVQAGSIAAIQQQIAPGLAAAAKGGVPLSGGLKQVAGGVSQLAANGGKLSSGTASLASGLSKLASGTSASASGASKLATGTKKIAAGTHKLASGLSDGAKQAAAPSKSLVNQTATVVSNPVTVGVHRANEVSSPAQIIATLFVPLGLWIGSLAVFLVMRPMTRRLLASTVGNGRIVMAAIARASIVTGAQALLLVILLHTAVGVSWALFPASLLFALVMALAFTAFHYLLTIGLGRGGLVVSLFLLAVQIVSTGGLYPIQLLAGPFQAVSPLLPLTYGVQGMQSIISDSGSLGSGLGAAFALVAFGVCSLLVALIAVRRTRRARALGLVPAYA